MSRPKGQYFSVTEVLERIFTDECSGDNEDESYSEVSDLENDPQVVTAEKFDPDIHCSLTNVPADHVAVSKAKSDVHGEDIQSETRKEVQNKPKKNEVLHLKIVPQKVAVPDTGDANMYVPSVRSQNEGNRDNTPRKYSAALLETYSPTPICRRPKSTVQKKSTTLPQYTPTPLRELEEMKSTEQGGKYTVNQTAVSDSEYDPEINYTTTAKYGATETKGLKRSSNDLEICTMKRKKYTLDDEGDIEANFSDDDSLNDDDDVDTINDTADSKNLGTCIGEFTETKEDPKEKVIPKEEEDEVVKKTENLMDFKKLQRLKDGSYNLINSECDLTSLLWNGTSENGAVSTKKENGPEQSTDSKSDKKSSHIHSSGSKKTEKQSSSQNDTKKKHASSHIAKHIDENQSPSSSKHKRSSSSSIHKGTSSSSSDKHRSRNSSNTSSSKHRSSNSSSSSSKHKSHSSSSSSSKDKSRSSSSSNSKDKSRSSSSSNSKDKSHRSSSSNSKDKSHSSSSSNSKDKSRCSSSSNSKDKSRSSSSSKHSSHSSSASTAKHKDHTSPSSSSTAKHKDHMSSSSKSKQRDYSSTKSEKDENDVVATIKVKHSSSGSVTGNEQNHKKHSNSKKSIHKTASSKTTSSESGSKSKNSSPKTKSPLSKFSDSSKSVADINVDLFGADSDNDFTGFGDEEVILIETESAEDLDFSSDIDPYDECLQIFNESKASNYSEIVRTADKKEDTHVEPGKQVYPASIRKRVAHHTEKAVERNIPKRPHSNFSPAQVMHNRFIALHKRAQDTVSTVSSKVLSKKKRISYHPPSTTSTTPEKLTIATVSKTEKRVAHVPVKVNVTRPTIPTEFGSKIATNLRQRYLNMIIDECLKLHANEEEAYKKGLEEEQSVYNRSANKSIYLNVAVNTIKRLRNLILEKSPPSDKPFKSNLFTMSHQDVLGGSAAKKCTFTINRSGKEHQTKTAVYSGADLFKRLTPYILMEEQLQANGFPRPSPTTPGSAVFFKASKKNTTLKNYEKFCIRCGRKFVVYPNGTYACEEECVFHWGKAFKKRVTGVIDTRYTCCEGDLEAEGCGVARLHVHESNKTDVLTGYMKTIPCSPPVDGDYGVFAMDCEMVYTHAGLELARVTVIGTDLKPIYETLVKPAQPIIDCNTRFSGLTMDDLENVKTTLQDVQAILLSLVSSQSILVGHSLESDLVAVRLLHSTVVDTSVVFPHKRGAPYKRALRNLMSEYCNKIIQNDVGGHDSLEDAVSCLELLQWRLKEDALKEVRRT